MFSGFASALQGQYPRYNYMSVMWDEIQANKSIVIVFVFVSFNFVNFFFVLCSNELL